MTLLMYPVDYVSAYPSDMTQQAVTPTRCTICKAWCGHTVYHVATSDTRCAEHANRNRPPFSPLYVDNGIR